MEASELNNALLKADMNEIFQYLYETDTGDTSLPNNRIYPLFGKPSEAKTKGKDETNFTIQTGGFESILNPHTESQTVNKRSNMTARELTITAQIFSGGFDVTQNTIDKAAARGKDGLKNFVKMQTQRMMEAYDLDMDCYFASENSTGTGILAQVNGDVVASTDVIFDNPGFVGQFRVGQAIDIYLAGAIEVDSAVIVDVDPSNLTITLDSAVTCTDDAYIYKEDAKDEMFDGLASIVNNTTFQGVDPTGAGNSFWKSIAVDGGAGAMSEAMLDDFIHDATLLGKGIAPTLLMMNWDTQKKIKSLLLADRVINDPTTVSAGFKIAQSLTTNFGNIPYVTNRFWSTNQIMGLNMKNIHMFNFIPFTWKKGVRGDILRDVGGKLDFEALYYVWFNYATDLRNVHSKLTNFTT